MKKILLTSAVALALMAGCSSEDYDELSNSSTSKLNVTGTVEEVKTRASGTEWAIGDFIGVSDADGNYTNIKYVAGSASGNFTAVTSDIYLSSGETMSFSAYYPFSGTEGTAAGEVEFSVIDESGNYASDNEANFDFLFADAVSASYSSPNVNFTFTHKMSKIKLNIKDSGDESSTAAVTYTLSNVAVDGTFNTSTGAVTANTTLGSVTNTSTLNASTYVILPSLSSSESAGEITLTVIVNDETYTGTLTPALAASTEYVYTVEIGESITITSSSINDWTSTDEGDIDMEQGEGETEEEETSTLEIGDYLCSDGTIIDKNETLTDEMISKIIGVVYYVGNPQPSTLYSDSYTTSQDVLYRDFPNLTNGLAIALNNATNSSGETSGRFGAGSYDYTTWLSAQTDADSYISTTLSIGSTSDLMLGYNNTIVIETAADDASYENFGTDFVDFLDTYRSTVTFDSGVASSWYLPSYQELTLLLENYSTISASIQAAGGSLEQYSNYDASTSELFYWSSNLRGSNYSWVSPLVATTDLNLFLNRKTNSTKGFFRLAVAF